MSMICDTLQVSRSAYYSWRRGDMSKRALEDNRLMPMIRDVFWENERRYGARRIAEELLARKQSCSRRRVSRLMARMGLVAIQPRSFKPRTTDSRHTLGYSPNLLADAPAPSGINQLWVGDITYHSVDRTSVPVPGADHGSLLTSHRWMGVTRSP